MTSAPVLLNVMDGNDYYVEKIDTAQVSIALFVVGVDAGNDNRSFDSRLFRMLWVKLNLA